MENKKMFNFNFVSDDNGDRYIGNINKTLVAQLHRRENQTKIFIWFFKYEENEEDNEKVMGEVCVENKKHTLKIFNRELENEILKFLKEIVAEFNIEVTSL